MVVLPCLDANANTNVNAASGSLQSPIGANNANANAIEINQELCHRVTNWEEERQVTCSTHIHIPCIWNLSLNG